MSMAFCATRATTLLIPPGPLMYDLPAETFSSFRTTRLVVRSGLKGRILILWNSSFDTSTTFERCSRIVSDSGKFLSLRNRRLLYLTIETNRFKRPERTSIYAVGFGVHKCHGDQGQSGDLDSNVANVTGAKVHSNYTKPARTKSAIQNHTYDFAKQGTGSQSQSQRTQAHSRS